ncbi:MAG: hypothetical protein ACTJHT_12150 [Sphingobacterium sp.]|uniref:hypothetical protein n=1 Tax=Sphingobacterium sp. JB170 TaxID=1434842 RepID=UPI00097F20E7|nr:hypothetical protein [Sphingobacterium sp. JB170]SJN48430.1 hypothetical protein FM107_17185 [Sphingobacterium sp. JB170]
MEKLIFETNVSSTSSLGEIHVAVKKVKGISRWHIELDSSYSMLTIEGKALDQHEIISQLSTHGVQANRVDEE